MIRPQLISLGHAHEDRRRALDPRTDSVAALFSLVRRTERSLHRTTEAERRRRSAHLDRFSKITSKRISNSFPALPREIGDHRYDDQLEIAISVEHIAGTAPASIEHTLADSPRLTATCSMRERRLHLEVLDRTSATRPGRPKIPNSHLLPVRQIGSMAVEFPLFGSGSRHSSIQEPSPITTIF